VLNRILNLRVFGKGMIGELLRDVLQSIFDIVMYLFDNVMYSDDEVHSMPETNLSQSIQRVRRFNRFYTKQIGVLREGLLKSPFSLTEVRVLYELAHREKPTATEIGAELGLDPGYLSRILRNFAKRSLIQKESSADDGRQNLLTLTKRGTAEFAALDARSAEEVAGMLQPLPKASRTSLLQAMNAIETVLGDRKESLVPRVPYVIRPPQPGDMGWVTHRHGVLYSEEYRYDWQFEALVSAIVAEFAQNFDANRERCWIAERSEGEIAGCIFLCKKSATIAKLRLLLVEPSARGLGIGKRLVAECVRFARQAGYKKMILWTQSELHAARHLYEQAGFHLVKKEPHQSWGRTDLVAETWEMKL